MSTLITIIIIMIVLGFISALIGGIITRNVVIENLYKQHKIDVNQIKNLEKVLTETEDKK